jgi:hypothetical protein
MEQTKCSREDMHAELRNALYQTVRCLAFVSNEDTALRVFGIAGAKKHGQGKYHLLSPDSAPEDFGFEPKGWEILETMERLYDYAMEGVARVDVESMGNETEYAFAAAYLYDYQRGAMRAEINNGEGGSVAKCLHVAQLAAARVALDGGERFFHFGRWTPDDALTIREIALLAGMEETSVRNAAVKGKPGALRTYQEDGNTLVTRGDALEWLKGRKGFTPTTRRHELGEVDLRTQSFDSLFDVDDYIVARLKTLGLTPALVAKKLSIDDKTAKQLFTGYFGDGGKRDDSFLRQLAYVLNVPPGYFVTHIFMAANRDEARALRKMLEDMKSKEASS